MKYSISKELTCCCRYFEYPRTPHRDTTVRAYIRLDQIDTTAGKVYFLESVENKFQYLLFLLYLKTKVTFFAEIV